MLNGEADRRTQPKIVDALIAVFICRPTIVPNILSKNVVHLCRMYNKMTMYLLTVYCTISPFWLHISEFLLHSLGITAHYIKACTVQACAHLVHPGQKSGVRVIVYPVAAAVPMTAISLGTIVEHGDLTLHAESIQNISNIRDLTILYFPWIQAIKTRKHEHTHSIIDTLFCCIGYFHIGLSLFLKCLLAISLMQITLWKHHH